MKQKITVDAGKKTAKPSIRKVGTILGSGALCVLTIGTISVCGLVNKSSDTNKIQSETKAAATTTITTTERTSTYTTLDTVAWRKASINEYDIAQTQATTSQTKAKKTSSVTTEKITEKNIKNKSMYATEIVKIRVRPNADAEACATLAQDDKVTVTAQTSNGWFAVTYDDYKGYVKADYLTSKVPASAKKSTKKSTTSKKVVTTAVAAKKAVTTKRTTTKPATTTAAVSSSRGYTVNCTDEEFDMLCYVLQGEVGSCSEASKLAVANVILNRVKSPAFPNSISGVLTSNNQFTAISGYYNRSTPPTQNTIDCARRALNGEDNSNGAIYYYAPQYCGGSTAAWFETLTFCMELDGQRYFKN